MSSLLVHLEVGARKVNAENKAAIKAERKAAVRELAQREAEEAEAPPPR